MPSLIDLRRRVRATKSTQQITKAMYMRLGFAVAINVDPDVLLIDEVLAVGDEGFTHKCLDKFSEFRRRGKTILLVTHSLGLVERFCDEALWIDEGLARASGDPRRVVGAYVTAVEKIEEASLAIGDQRALEQSTVAPPAEIAAVSDPVAASEAPIDMAEELLKLYAARKTVVGHAFAPDTHWQQEFEDAFPYDLTPDQTSAIADIKRDLESPTPMDRLLCGDVGYGKTEVAMQRRSSRQ